MADVCDCLFTTVVALLVATAAFTNCSFYHIGTANLILCVVIFLFTYLLIKRYFCEAKISFINKAVLITGCDSGFGNQLAKRLDSRGFHVFASCLFPEGSGAEELKLTCSKNLKVLALDVSSDESVENAFKFVKENLGSNDLWAVVNNAGIAKGFSLDFSTIQHFKDTINVNLLGTVRVSKAFMPLLKKSKGRVINVSSLIGRVPVIQACPYSISKRAVIAFSECLGLEMRVWGVRVINIEPETFRTPIRDAESNINRMRADIDEIDENIASSYGKEYFEKLEKVINKMANFSSSNIDIVIDAMESAVTKKHPYHVYKPRWSLYTAISLFILENIPFSIYEKMIPVILRFVCYPIPKDAKT